MSFPYPIYDYPTPTQPLEPACQRMVWVCDGKTTYLKLVWNMDLNDDGTCKLGETLCEWWPYKGN